MPHSPSCARFLAGRLSPCKKRAISPYCGERRVPSRGNGVMLTSQLNGSGPTAAPRRRNVLLVYPRFSNESFWNYRKSCEVVGARYPTIPLGLITVAAMLPSHWDVRLVNCNTEELLDEDL